MSSGLNCALWECQSGNIISLAHLTTGGTALVEETPAGETLQPGLFIIGGEDNLLGSPGSGSDTGSVRSVALRRVTEAGGDQVCLLELADGRDEGDLGPE